MKAFEKVFGHAPLSSADWATAAALDPHSYNAKNGGVPPEHRRRQDRTGSGTGRGADELLHSE